MWILTQEYTLISSIVCIEGMSCTTYGITGYGMTFSDISTDKQKVEEMISRINEAQLEPCHLMEFIEDELV